MAGDFVAPNLTPSNAHKNVQSLYSQNFTLLCIHQCQYVLACCSEIQSLRSFGLLHVVVVELRSFLMYTSVKVVLDYFATASAAEVGLVLLLELRRLSLLWRMNR